MSPNAIDALHRCSWPGVGLPINEVLASLRSASASWWPPTPTSSPSDQSKSAVVASDQSTSGGDPEQSAAAPFPSLCCRRTSPSSEVSEVDAGEEIVGDDGGDACAPARMREAAELRTVLRLLPIVARSTARISIAWRHGTRTRREARGGGSRQSWREC
jgi:hypothetical protein